MKAPLIGAFLFSIFEKLNYELMEVFTGIAGLLIAWLTYHKTFNSKPDEERNNLLTIFKVTQKIHLEIQLLLQKYIDDNNGANHELYPKITFRQTLDLYKQEFEKGLSEKVYLDLKNNQIYTKSNITTFQNMIDTQHNALLKFISQLLFLNNPQEKN